ncbi:hypothetical protein FRC12_021722 [Ceratobasidium sp. 428]|nr:hypothetical protein FRC12_021722 [Ceratobasidium sp. 428]
MSDQSNPHSKPCAFQPSCPDQCPSLQVDPANASRCICGHLISLHVESTEESPATTPTPSFTVTRPLQVGGLGSQLHGRLLSKLSALRGGVGLGSLPTASTLPTARAEVNAGFLGPSRRTPRTSSRSTPGSASHSTSSRSTSRSTPQSGSQSASRSVSRSVSQRKASATSASTSELQVGSNPQAKGKGKGKGKSDQPADIHGIYFVPDAYRSITKRVNNAGVELTTVDCHAPTPRERDELVQDGFGRVSKGTDVIQLDPQLDAEQMAQLLATLFPAIYARAREHFGVSEDDPAPPHWYMRLIKTRTRLSNQSNEQGTSARQLISGASTVGGKVSTRDIYLGTVFSIDDGDVMSTSCDEGDGSDSPPGDTPSPPEVATLAGKGKRKRSEESEESEESDSSEKPKCSTSDSNKRLKIGDTSTNNSTNSLPDLTPPHSRQRLRPRPRLRIPSNESVSLGEPSPDVQPAASPLGTTPLVPSTSSSASDPILSVSPVPPAEPVPSVELAPSAIAPPSPTGTVIEILSDVEEVTSSFSQSLGFRNIPLEGVGEAGPGPQTRRTRQEQELLDHIAFMMKGLEETGEDYYTI